MTFNPSVTTGTPPPPQKGGFAPSVATGNSYVSQEPQYQVDVPPAVQPTIAPTYQNWNYRTSKVSPTGEPLPSGATGWNPDGTPDFGKGIDGFLKQAQFNYTNSKQKIDGLIKEFDGENPSFMSYLKAAPAAGWEGVKNLFGIVGPGLNWLGTKVEQVAGSVGYALDDMLYRDRSLNEIDWKNNWEAGRVAYSVAISPFMEQKGNVFQSSLSGQQIRDEFIRRLDAGEDPEDIETDMIIRGDIHWLPELSFEMIFDPLNAVGKGQKVTKAAMAKMGKLYDTVEAGGVVADLVKATDAGTDFAKVENLAEATAKIQNKINEVASGVDALRTPGLIKKVGNKLIDGFIKYTPDARRYGLNNISAMTLNNIAAMMGNDAGRTMEILTAWANLGSSDVSIARAATAMVLKSPNPTLLLSPAGNVSNVIMRDMILNQGDELLSILSKGQANARTARRITSLASDIERGKDIAGATKKLLKVGKPVAKEGDELSNLLLDIEKGVDVGTNTKKISELVGKSARADNVAQIAANLTAVTNNVTKKLFPSSLDMLQAMDKAKELAKAGAQIPDEVARLAKMGEKMTPTNRAIAKLHNSLQAGPVGFINKKILNRMYLGMSPGYVFRNWQQGMVQMVMDYGPGVLYDTTKGGIKGLFSSADEMYFAASKGAGFALPSGGKAGVMGTGAVQEATQRTGFVDQVRAFWKKLDTRAAAEVSEANQSRRIVAHTFVGEFRKGTEKMIKKLADDKRFASMPPEMWDTVRSALENNFGDIPRAMEELRRAAKYGLSRSFEDYRNLPGESWKFLDSIDVLPTFIEKVLKAPSQEAALSSLDEIFKGLDDMSATALAEPAKYNLDDKFEMILANGEWQNSDKLMWAVRTRVMKSTASEFGSAISKLQDDLNKLAAQTGVPVPVADMMEKYGIKALTTWDNGKYLEVSQKAEAFFDVLKGGKKVDAAMYEELSKLLGVDAPLEQAMEEANDITDACYRLFRKWKGVEWDEQMTFAINEQAYLFLDEVEGAAGTKFPGTRAMMDRARDNYTMYQEIAVSDMGMLVKQPFQKGEDKIAYIARLAEKYGLPEAFLSGGRPNENFLLNTINKYGDFDYGDLQHIDLDLIDRALAKKAGANLATADDLRKVAGVGKSVPPISGRAENMTSQELLKFQEAYYAPTGHEYVEFYHGTGDVNGVLSSGKLVAGKGGLDALQGTQVGKGGSVYLSPDLSYAKNYAGYGASAGVKYADPGVVLVRVKRKTGTLNNIELILSPSDKDYEIVGRVGDAVAQATQGVKRTAEDYLLKPHDPKTSPSWLYALRKMNLKKIAEELQAHTVSHFDDTKLIPQDANWEDLFGKLEGAMTADLAKVRTVASATAEEARNFTLLDYPMRTYGDVFSSYLYPFGFWYKGTYSNYIKRAVMQPGIMSNYARYKERMGQIHADAPEFWKYQVSPGDFGIDMENPIYFNLESALWPLNGITGVDFNDPEKSVNWFTYYLQEMGKVGPTIWTPITVATGLALRAQGDERAGNAWLGRLIPQSQLIKEFTGKEIDPFVGWFQGGYDKYESSRIGRALKDLEGKYTPEELVDAANTRSGPAWEEAAGIVQQSRRGPQAMSFLFGVGYKARTERDMEIDAFYAAQTRIFNQRELLSDEDFRNQMNELYRNFPQSDYILLAKKNFEERDIAYAYNVLARIPPGDMTNVLGVVGIDEARINAFYEAKGDMSGWGQGEQEQFMGGLAMLASVMKIPSGAVREEWAQTKTMYRQAEEQISSDIGLPYEDDKRGIWDLVETYYSLLDSDPQKAQALAELAPIQEALDMKRAYIANTPELYKYYGSLDTLESYYQSRSREAMMKRFGDDIYDLSADYSILSERAKLGLPGAKELLSKFKKEHYKELQQFWSAKDGWEAWVNESVIKVGARMPSQPNIETRQLTDPTLTQAFISSELNAPRSVTPEQILSNKNMRPEILELVQMYFSSGEEMPSVATRRLDYIARDLGISVNELLQILGVYFTQAQ